MSEPSPPTAPATFRQPDQSAAETAGLEIALEERMERFMASTGDPVANAMAREMTGDHITQVLDLAKEREVNRHREATQGGPFVLMCVVVLLLFVFALAWLTLSYGHSEIITPIITALVGALGGFGIGRSMKKPSQTE